MAFYSFQFNRNDKILTSICEYASNYLAFLHIAKRTGVTIEVIANDVTGQLDVNDLEQRIDGRVKLIAITHVPTQGGLVNPAEEVGRIAKKHNIPYLLDTTQSVGQMPVDVKSIGCDFLGTVKRIVEQEQHGKARADYGEYLIVSLSRYLTDCFGKGFSVANLWNFRQFYLTFNNFEQFSTHRVENLCWSHLRLIMRLDDEKERYYYLLEASQQNWTTRLLDRNIKSGYYRRLLSSQSLNQSEIVNQNNIPHPSHFIKDPYILEFLDVPENLTGKESLLESNIIDHLQKFLLELGKGFSFVARQMRVSTETSNFYVDLVFYNYLLKCFIIIDLKTDKLTHQDLGQMDMYVRMFDELKRGEGDNPTLGIILCTDKDETIVKYSVLKESKQIFASKYKTILPTENELKALIEQENLRQDHGH